MADRISRRYPFRWTLLCGLWLAVATAEDRFEGLGEVNFPVSCSEATRPAFNRAMAQLHSFWFGPARTSFQLILAEDPSCGMAHWGIAMVALGNPFGWPAPPDAQERAAAALAGAREAGAASQRERDLIAALGRYLADREATPHRERVLAYEQAMQQLAGRYADDVEVQILYALVLNAAASPTDKTFARQRRAAGILAPLFERYPQHPGIAH